MCKVALSLCLSLCILLLSEYIVHLGLQDELCRDCAVHGIRGTLAAQRSRCSTGFVGIIRSLYHASVRLSNAFDPTETTVEYRRQRHNMRGKASPRRSDPLDAVKVRRRTVESRRIASLDRRIPSLAVKPSLHRPTQATISGEWPSKPPLEPLPGRVSVGRDSRRGPGAPSRGAPGSIWPR